MGKAMFIVIAAMAELERNIIRVRVLAGLEHANRNGTRSGRPVGRPKVVLERERIRQLRDAEKLSWSEIASGGRSGDQIP
jgi:DNA invertase Pin-like site-specific DNA recombinase